MDVDDHHHDTATPGAAPKTPNAAHEPDAQSDAEAEHETSRRRRRWSGAWAWLGGVLAVMVVVALVAAYFVRLPYVILSPGDVYPLDQDALTVEGAPTYESDDELLFLTVSITRQRPNVYRYLRERFNSSSEILPERDYYGVEPPGDTLARDILLMEQSQTAARIVALEALGFDFDIDQVGVLVYGIIPNHAARGNLQLGDIITAIDGQATPTPVDVRAIIQAHDVGDDVVVTVDRHVDVTTIETMDIEVTLGEAEGVPVLGVVLQSYVQVPVWPVEITLNTQQVTGSSAGLAFALAIIDLLSPGDLAGGNTVAITGTLALDGTVGSVGGVELKAQSARRAGAALLIVPSATVEEAKRGAGSVPVVGVDTIEEALAALAALGGEIPASVDEMDLAA